MRRGLTLVETLGAIALLGAMVVASAHWITAALRLSSETNDAVIWEQGAQRTLDLIARDIDIGDFDDGGPKVWVADEQLVIRTRAASTNRSPGGTVEHTYTLHSAGEASRLVCEVRGSYHDPVRDTAARTTRALVGAMTGFSAELRDVEDRLILTVSLTSRSGELTREFEL